MAGSRESSFSAVGNVNTAPVSRSVTTLTDPIIAIEDIVIDKVC